MSWLRLRPRGGLGFFLALLSGQPAWAHAVLMHSMPGAGCMVPPGPAPIELRYNSLIDAERSLVTLAGPAGQTVRLPVERAARGDSLEAHTALTPGGYMLRWQVLAIDGHITRGIVDFNVGAGADPCARASGH